MGRVKKEKIQLGDMQKYLMRTPGVWHKTRKKKYTVGWCIPCGGYKCTNRFENTTYVAQESIPVLVMGTCGEFYMMSIDSFLNSYCANYLEVMYDWKSVYREGNRVPWKKTQSRVSQDAVYFAYKTQSLKPFEIRTSTGQVLTANTPGVEHKTGDYVVCRGQLQNNKWVPDFSDMWVVNEFVFESTYDMRGMKDFKNK